MSRIAGVLGQEDDELLFKMINSMVVHGPCIKTTVQGEGFSFGSLENSPPENSQKQLSMVIDGYLSPHEEPADNNIEEQVNPSSVFTNNNSSELSPEGEFAVAWKDKKNYLIARDPFGVKPLYYTYKNNRLLVASEIKALAHFNTSIKEFPPGSCYEYNKGWSNYYSFNSEENNYMEEDIIKQMLREQLKQAVREKIEENLPWGVYLSGGLDSSVIAILAAEISNQPITTITVGIKGSEDVDRAREVSRIIGSNHHEYIYTEEEILDLLPEVIFHLESFDCAYLRSSIPNFLAAKIAREHNIKLMLSGEGADEIFAGYSYLKNITDKNKINIELHNLIKGLHHTGLQRVDRMNAAHGLECRLPFLKPSLVEFVMSLPVEWKLWHKSNGNLEDKWILRSAFEGDLGSELAWREKQQFDQGAGSNDMLEKIAEETISDKEFEKEAAEAPTPVRNKEELMYYRIFNKYFPLDVIPLVGRWVTTG